MTNTTPHPTDALPLPDLSEERINNIADLTVKGMPDGIRGFCVTWGWQQFARALLENFDNTIRAAHREGYELAMRKAQEGREPVGYMNAGHICELENRRIPYGYVYPFGGVGAEIPVYTSPPPKSDEARDAEREPVARVELMTTGGNAGIATRIVEIDDQLRERLSPGALLYTSPPPKSDEARDAYLSGELELVLTDKDTKLSNGAARTIRYVVAALAAQQKGGAV